MSWILGFIFAPLLIGVLLVFIFATRANWVASHKRQLGWVIIFALAAVMLYSFFGDSVGNLFASAQKEAGNLLTDSPFWVYLVGIAIIGFLVYLLYNRRKGFETIRGAAIFLLMVGAAGFIINIMDKAVEPTPLGNGCTTQEWFKNNELDKEGSRVWLKPGIYKIRVPNGKGVDFGIEFLESPLAYDSSFEPGDISEYVTWYHNGSPIPHSNSLTVGSVKLVVHFDAYNKRIGNRCLGYRVYVK